MNPQTIDDELKYIKGADLSYDITMELYDQLTRIIEFDHKNSKE